jgi:hypothetical protein
MMRGASCAAILVAALAPCVARAQDAPTRETPWRGEVDGGVGIRSLFGLDILGGMGELRGGAQIRPWLGVYGDIGYFRGSTPTGLPVWTGQIGSRIDFVPLPHFHVGVGWGLLSFDLARASSKDDIDTVGLGADLFVRYQFFDCGPFATFVELRADAVDLDLLQAANSQPFFGLTLTGGFRF